MKIGVLSDSHLHRYDDDFAATCLTAFVDCELILHAGDFVTLAAADIFAEKRFWGVCGNMDEQAVCKRFPVVQRLDVLGRKIVLVHDLTTLSQEEIASSACVVFGHTHIPANIVSGGTLFFNPGSASGKRNTGVGSVGILEIDAGISGKIISICSNHISGRR